MIDSSEISVVVQGPVRPDTAESLSSVRRVLPRAEIIFSTWGDEKADGLPFDKIVRSRMPPAYAQHIRTGILNNLNRLIRSTKAGVAKAERPYLLKIRSDLVLTDDRFLHAFEDFPAEGPRKVFSRRVVVPLIYSRTGYRGFCTPFHLSDWAAFGLSEDLRPFYLNMQEVDDPAFTQYFLGREKETPYGPTLLRMAPEQYQAFSAFQRHFHDADMPDCSVVTEKLSCASDEYIVSNFIIAPYAETGWMVRKYPQSIDEFKEGAPYFELWTKFVYESKYRRLCDPSYELTAFADQRRFRRRDAYEGYFRLRKHCEHLLHADRFSKRLEQVFVIPIMTLMAAGKALLGLKHTDSVANAERFKPFGQFQ